MRTVQLILFLCFMVLFPSSATATVSIAVLGFESGDLPWTDDRRFEDEILEGVTNRFTNSLAGVDFLSVIDRSRVRDALIQLQQSSTKLEPAVATQAGRLVGSNLLFIGSVDSISLTERRGIQVGPFTLSGIQAQATISGRVIDGRTGTVIARAQGRGQASQTGISVDDLMGISFDAAQFDDSAVSLAIDRALEELIEHITNQQDAFVTASDPVQSVVVEGEVLTVVGESLLISIGRNQGVEQNMEGTVVRSVEIPGGDPMAVTIGSVQVTSVDQDASLVRIVEAAESISAGDSIHLTSDSNAGQNATTAAPGIIKTVETPDFIIYLERITRSDTRVTIHGTAKAREADALLTLRMEPQMEFHDHLGQRRSILGRNVTIGLNRGATVSEQVLFGYPQAISWTISNVPAEATHFARLRLSLETERAGTVQINLDGLRLDGRL